MPLTIDDRDDRKATYYVIPSYRAGVKCDSCGWRGYRSVRIKKNLARVAGIDRTRLSRKIRGKNHYLPCPKCHQRTVVHTHLTGFPMI